MPFNQLYHSLSNIVIISGNNTQDYLVALKPTLTVLSSHYERLSYGFPICCSFVGKCSLCTHADTHADVSIIKAENYVQHI